MKRLRKILKWNDWVAFFALSIIWGSSFILIKKSLIAFNGYEVANLRILITTIFFLPYFIFNIKKIDFKQWYKFLLVGLAGGGIPTFLFAIAQTKVSSSLAGALNTLTPIFTLIIAVLFFTVKVNLKNISGVIISFLGAGLMIILGNPDFTGSITYSLLIIIATVFYAININLVKKYFSDMNAVLLTAVSFISFGFISLIPLIRGNFIDIMISDDRAWLSLSAVIVLSLLSTVLGTILFFKLVQKSNAIFASSVSFMAPVISFLLGLLDGEKIDVVGILGLILILVGIYLTRNRKNNIKNLSDEQK
ncbi:MAG: DMT family transporter [Saprospiraceae bacterium]